MHFFSLLRWIFIGWICFTKISIANEIQLGVALPWDGYYGQYAIQAAKACELAVRTVNMSSNILPNVNLKLKSVNMEEITTGMQDLAGLLLDGSINGIIGPYTSDEAIQVSFLVTTTRGANSSIPLITGSATAPQLTNDKDHPLVSRTIPSDGGSAVSLAYFCKQVGWKRVGVLFSTTAFGEGLADDIASLARAWNVEVARFISHKSTQYYPLEEVKKEIRTELQLLKETGVRVIFYGGSFKDMRTVLLLAKEMDFFGQVGDATYQWVSGADGVDPSIFSTGDDCDDECSLEFRKAGRGFISIGPPFLVNTAWQKTTWNPQVSSDKLTDVEKSVSKLDDWSNAHMNVYVPFYFDAVITLANATGEYCMNQEMVSESECYEGLHFDGEEVLEIVKKMDFSGASGEVRFSETADRVESIEIRYMTENGDWIHVGDHLPSSSDPPKIDLEAIIWPDGTNDVPPSMQRFRTSRSLVALAFGILVLFFIVTGVCFVIIKVKRKNNIIRVGVVTVNCMLVVCVCEMLSVGQAFFSFISFINPHSMYSCVIDYWFKDLFTLVSSLVVLANLYRYNRIVLNKRLRVRVFSKKHTVMVVLVGLIWPVVIGIINAVPETGVQWYWLISLQHTSNLWQYFDVCSSSFMYQLSRQPYTSIFLSKYSYSFVVLVGCSIFCWGVASVSSPQQGERRQLCYWFTIILCLQASIGIILVCGTLGSTDPSNDKYIAFDNHLMPTSSDVLILLASVEYFGRLLVSSSLIAGVVGLKLRAMAHKLELDLKPPIHHKRGKIRNLKSRHLQFIIQKSEDEHGRTIPLEATREDYFSNDNSSHGTQETISDTPEALTAMMLSSSNGKVRRHGPQTLAPQIDLNVLRALIRDLKREKTKLSGSWSRLKERSTKVDVKLDAQLEVFEVLLIRLKRLRTSQDSESWYNAVLSTQHKRIQQATNASLSISSKNSIGERRSTNSSLHSSLPSSLHAKFPRQSHSSHSELSDHPLMPFTEQI